MKARLFKALLGLAVAIGAWAEPPRYVIMMIGDGMGWAQVQLAEGYVGAEEGNFRGRLVMTGLPVAGVVRTHSANAHVTDSGAGGTALACGIKTRNGSVGVDTNGWRYVSLATLAKRAGKKVGIITTDSLVGATPAAFYAHRTDRWCTYPIGVDLFRSGFDIVVAASDFDDPAGLAIPTNVLCALTNELSDLVVAGNCATNTSGITWTELHALTAVYGYGWITNASEWYGLAPGTGKYVAVLDIPYGIADRTGGLTLAAVTRKCIELLSSPSGFFLLVEGARIDKCGHINDSAASVFETLAFDDAVGAVYEFYTNHVDETLLVVTADHETGGMTFGHNENKLKLLGRQRGLAAEFQEEVTKYRSKHTLRGLIGRWWANVVGSEDAGKRGGSFEDIKPLLQSFFGFDDENEGVILTQSEWQELEWAFEESMGGRRWYPDDEVLRAKYGGYDPLTVTATRILGEHAGVRWSTFDHSAAHVPVFAAGVGSAWFNGILDNTEIPRYIVRVMLPWQDFPLRGE
ncbi:MAG: alkaline phosphatase [bacterium]|nr:alkaline phosphatase [bacterium]